MLPSAVALLPTPVAGDAERASGHYVRGNPTLVGALVPTPAAMRGGHNRSPSPGAAVRPSLDSLATTAADWGPYAAAIARWEIVLGRPAPPPTITGRRGGRKLNPDLTDWLMGWPAGWTDVPGISVNDRLRIGGNGAVRQQAATALCWLLSRLYDRRSAA